MRGKGLTKMNKVTNESKDSNWCKEEGSSTHIHAEKMRLYAEDATRSNRPWMLWEFKKNLFYGEWLNCPEHPKWDTDTQYRRKITYRTFRLGNVTIKQIIKKPQKGETYYVPSMLSIVDYHRPVTWVNDISDNNYWRDGLVYDDPWFAEVHGRELINIVRMAQQSSR